MASIRRRGSKWQAQVRRRGFPTLAKSFDSRADAATWSREKERAIDRAELPATARDLKGITVKALLDRYSQTISSQKRGANVERYRIVGMCAHPLGRTALERLAPAAVAAYRDDRLKHVQSGTVRRELAILQHCLEVARREWGYPIISNPVRQIALPEPSKPRARRLSAAEEHRLVSALKGSSAWYLAPFIALAVETGLRRGELLSLEWRNLNLQQRTALVVRTKNGHARTVPLSRKGIALLSELPRTTERVFPIKPNAVRLAWERLRTRAAVSDLRLHDLRHEAISRFFEKGLSVPEVAMISGHRDARMLFRYTHPQPELVAQKL